MSAKPDLASPICLSIVFPQPSQACLDLCQIPYSKYVPWPGGVFPSKIIIHMISRYFSRKPLIDKFTFLLSISVWICVKDFSHKTGGLSICWYVGILIYVLTNKVRHWSIWQQCVLNDNIIISGSNTPTLQLNTYADYNSLEMTGAVARPGRGWWRDGRVVRGLVDPGSVRNSRADLPGQILHTTQNREHTDLGTRNLYLGSG